MKQSDNTEFLKQRIRELEEEIEKFRQKEQLLAEAEERIKVIAEHTSDVIWLTDLEMNLKYVTPSIKNFRGYTIEEHITQKPEEKYTPVSLVVLKKRLEEALYYHTVVNRNDKNRVWKLELQYYHKNKSLVWGELFAKFIFDEKGNPTGLLGVTRDITERKKTRKELADKTLMLEQSQRISKVGSWIFDFNSRIGYWSNEQKQIFGLDKNEKGLSTEDLINNLVHPVDKEMVRKITAEIIKTKKYIPFEYRTLLPDGQIKHIYADGEVFLDRKGNISAIIGINKDITEQKESETELIKAKERAEQSDRLKSVFLANMSHEIRTPMNAIMGFSDLLRSPDISEEEKQEFIEIINERSNYLLNIINDIIDLSKIEANQLDITETECSLSELYQDLNSAFLVEVKKKPNLQLVFEEIPADVSDEILVDDTRLNQILSNLISNAVKYTREGTVTVSSKLDTNCKNLIFSVKDTGIGIPEKMYTTVFERFRQVEDSDTREFGGTGLGLTISRSLVEKMGGCIWVESEINKGSTFFFTIPYKTVW